MVDRRAVSYLWGSAGAFSHSSSVGLRGKTEISGVVLRAVLETRPAVVCCRRACAGAAGESGVFTIVGMVPCDAGDLAVAPAGPPDVAWSSAVVGLAVPRLPLPSMFRSLPVSPTGAPAGCTVVLIPANALTPVL